MYGTLGTKSMKGMRRTLEGGPMPPSFYKWERPADWLAMPYVAETENKIVGLVAVFDVYSNFYAFSCVGAYAVDWGDGSAVENVASGVVARHTYDYADLAGTECSRGYRQALITITPQAGSPTAAITSVNFNQVPTGLNSYPTQGWLDLVIAAPSLTSFTLSPSSGTTYMHPSMLERLRILSTGTCSLQYAFGYCYSLQSVELNIPNVTSMLLAFQYSRSLRHLTITNVGACTTFSQMCVHCRALEVASIRGHATNANWSDTFQNCSSLRVVSLGDTSGSTTFSQMFYGCRSLEEAPFLDLSGATTLLNMFAYCSALQHVPIYSVPAGCTNLSGMFSYCSNLEEVELRGCTGVTNTSSMFYECFALHRAVIPTTGSACNGTSMFYNCGRLRELEMDTSKISNFTTFFYQCQFETCPDIDTTAATTMANMFQYCMRLRVAPALDLNGVTSMASMFDGCWSMQEVPAYDTSSVTTIANLFSSCYALLKVGSMNFAAVTTTTNALLNATMLALWYPYGLRYGHTMSLKPISTNEMNAIWHRLGKANGAQTFTSATTLAGGMTTISKTTCGTTSGSQTVTQTNTSSLEVGQYVYGSGLSTNGRAVTMEATGDIIRRTAHGIPDGTLVAFATAYTSSSPTAAHPNLGTYQYYYTASATADTFQLVTEVGSPGSLVTVGADGYGTLMVATKITAISLNVSFTVDVPAHATASVTCTFNAKDTTNRNLLFFKGWSLA